MQKRPAGKPSAAFTEADLSRIQAETLVQQIEFHRELASTNDLALKFAGQDGLPCPLLVLAEIQTAGRGRRANRWWSAEGALTFSLLLKTEAAQLPPHRWSRASLTAGLAVCEALEELLTDAEIRLKWPNDVYVQRRKVCGILVEAPPLQSGKLVLGVGLNVNNSLTGAPDEISETASALCDVAGHPFSLVDVLVCVLGKLSSRLAWIGSRDHELRERWRKRCLLTNRQVQIDTDTSRMVGLCQGIDDAGALVVRTGEGLKRCFAGTVTLLDCEH